jgi:hypothetical protein
MGGKVTHGIDGTVFFGEYIIHADHDLSPLTGKGDRYIQIEPMG